MIPKFKYFADPVGNGLLIPSTHVCCVCKKNRGFIYTDVPFKDPEDDENVPCPWCIADGSYWDTLDEDDRPSFMSVSNYNIEVPKIVGHKIVDGKKADRYLLNETLFHLVDEKLEPLPDDLSLLEENINRKTLCIITFQDFNFLYHCEDACQFIGYFDSEKAKNGGPLIYDAIFRACMRDCMGVILTEDQIKTRAQESLSKLTLCDHTALVFQCLTCKKYFSYTDHS